MQAQLNAAISMINGYLWDYLIIFILIGAGLYFTFTTKFVQIRYLGEMIRLIASSAGEKTEKNHISSFQAFCVTTASRVGVGNIAGIAIAVVIGGPGAIFWMWVIALLGASTGFVECTLAQIYKKPLANGGFYGGPAYYIKQGLNSPGFSVLFAVLITITFGWIYNSVQANTLAASLVTLDVPAHITGGVVAALILVIVFGGLSAVAKVAEILVPVMAFAYIGTALYVMITNITQLPHVFYSIFSNAFTLDAAGGGLFGTVMMTGIKRGLFSNEAGQGSVPNAAATATANHPVEQGLIQAFGVYLTTFIICTASAFIVLIIGDYTTTGLTGVALVQYNLAQELGPWAPYAMALFIVMFSFSSLVGNYYYGEINITHLTDKKIYLNLFRVGVVAMAYIGSVASLELVWNAADLFMAFLILTNITAIVLLNKQAVAALADYVDQKRRGIKVPVFNKKVLPTQEGLVWWGDGQTTDSTAAEKH